MTSTAIDLRFLDKLAGDRDLHAYTLLRQIGNVNVAAISGGRSVAHMRALTSQYATAVELPVGEGRSVLITLSGLDYYIVRRIRRVFRGKNRGRIVIEHEVHDIDCTQVGEAAYQAACWK